MHAATLSVGNAVPFGLGLGVGLVLVPCMFQAMAPPSRIAKRVIVCLSCRGRNMEEFKFCGHCGRSLYPPPQILCPKCNVTVPSMKYCENCGTKLKK